VPEKEIRDLLPGQLDDEHRHDHLLRRRLLDSLTSGERPPLPPTHSPTVIVADHRLVDGAGVARARKRHTSTFPCDTPARQAAARAACAR
jgi:hypothetical protein